MSQLASFRDLRVYQKLKALHLEVHGESLAFPKFEMYELGSQIRRSSNSAPALVAEGWGSRHTNMYIEAINRAMTMRPRSKVLRTTLRCGIPRA